jgi:hypothetical protein
MMPAAVCGPQRGRTVRGRSTSGPRPGKVQVTLLGSGPESSYNDLAEIHAAPLGKRRRCLSAAALDRRWHTSKVQHVRSRHAGPISRGVAERHAARSRLQRTRQRASVEWIPTQHYKRYFRRSLRLAATQTAADASSAIGAVTTLREGRAAPEVLTGMRSLARGALHHRRATAGAHGDGSCPRSRQLKGLASEVGGDHAKQLLTIDQRHADLRGELLRVGGVPTHGNKHRVRCAHRLLDTVEPPDELHADTIAPPVLRLDHRVLCWTCLVTVG